MEFQELIEKRRSVRKYSAGHRIPKEHIMEMIQAAQEAPSWKNSQTGRYYCLLSEEMTRQFRADCLPSGNALKSENATLIVTTFVRNRSGFKQNGTADNELENGWGCYDLGLQNANLVLKAEELGYGTLIIGIRDAQKIREFLSVPEEEIIVSVIAVGIPAEEPKRPKRKETKDIVSFL
ncbi:nitroreductase family protein [Blautia sp. XA-2221]|uniref:nitroreductase family protein n=1 Tax=Blautia sp. XA-2221 TaxID=2903961 RepID=UPI00237871F5|nr:nitroreductase family protein [Blautia sp. XA-2221]